MLSLKPFTEYITNSYSVNQKQIQTADEILKFLDSQNGDAEKDQLTFRFLKGQFEDSLTESLRWKEITHIISLLSEQDFVEWIPPSNYFLRLKTKGTKAAQVGLNNFLIQEEQREQAKNVSTIIDNRQNISGNTIIGSMISQSREDGYKGMNEQANGVSKKIVTIVLGVVTALIAGFLMYKFGWRK